MLHPWTVLAVVVVMCLVATATAGAQSPVADQYASPVPPSTGKPAGAVPATGAVPAAGAVPATGTSPATRNRRPAVVVKPVVVQPVQPVQPRRLSDPPGVWLFVAIGLAALALVSAAGLAYRRRAQTATPIG